MYPTIVSSSVGYTLVLFLTGIASELILTCQTFWNTLIMCPLRQMFTCSMHILYILSIYVEQFNIYYIGLVPSKFYLALLDGSREEFKNIIWEMCILVITVSLVTRKQVDYVK